LWFLSLKAVSNECAYIILQSSLALLSWKLSRILLIHKIRFLRVNPAVISQESVVANRDITVLRISFLNTSYGLTIAKSEEVIWKYHDVHCEVQDRAFGKTWKVELW